MINAPFLGRWPKASMARQSHRSCLLKLCLNIYFAAGAAAVGSNCEDSVSIAYI
jgi:hypothetical protein